MTMRIPDKTLLDLEWERIVDAIASRCAGPLASRITMPLAADASVSTSKGK